MHAMSRITNQSGKSQTIGPKWAGSTHLNTEAIEIKTLHGRRSGMRVSQPAVVR